MSSWRSSSGLAGRRSAPPSVRPAAYRGLAPVRPGGRSAGRVRVGRAPGLGGGRRGTGRIGRVLRLLFGSGSPLRHLDWLLLAAVLALCVVGTLLVWSATATPGATGSDPYLTKEFLNIGIGLVLMAAVSMLDYRQLRMYAPVVLGLSCLGLLAVLSPLGTVVNGAKSWIDLPGGFQIEPSEYAKLSIILVSAMILAELRQGETRPAPRSVGLMIGCCLVPLVLVLAEPDLGVVMLMVALMVGLIALSGVKLRWLAALVGGGALALTAVIKLHLLAAYQVSRLDAFLHPSANPLGSGYSAYQSKTAIGSGGVWGDGLFHGQLITGGYVPEAHTDFIFSVAGEDLGLAGCLLIVVLLGLVLLRAIRIAARADDQFGMLVAVGIAIWFAVQSFINIGMTIGIMPVTGLPLPFVSYGGSALFADMIAVGVLHTVSRHRTVFG